MSLIVKFKLSRIILGLYLFLPLFALAQNPCGTPHITAEAEIAHQELIQRLQAAHSITNRSPTAITYIPIKPHLARTAAGANALSLTELNDALAELNRVFQTIDVVFYFSGTAPNYIDNDALSNGTYTSADALGFQNTVGATNAHNIYFCSSVGGAGGYSYGNTQNKDYNRTYVINGQANDNKTLTHEIGHYLNLAHTFNNSTSATVADRELVTRNATETLPRLAANCSTKGDYVCDTPSDPRGLGDAAVNSCVYSGTITDANGDAFSPLVNNIMDYNFCSPYYFTAGQYARMQAGVLVVTTPSSNAAIAYTLNAPETAQTAPSGLTVTAINSSISLGNIITWADNSTLETGYIIERSTTSGGSFEPIGGVAPDATSFTDKAISKNTTYYYRVKPSNSKTNYSSVTNFTTPFYCGPNYTSTCVVGSTTANHVINRFKVATKSIVTLFDNNNSGCSANSYGDYYNTYSATVSKGVTYDFTMNTFYGTNGYFPQHLGIFIDANQDGDFDDAGEQVYQSTGTIMSGTTLISSSFTVPSTTLNGTTRMRVRCRYNSSMVLDACGTYSGGETEDYKLIIQAVLPIELLAFTAKPLPKTTSNLLSWQTANEENNKGFQVERKQQSNDSWDMLGFVNGKGKDGDYEFIDPTPLQTSYYRLRQIDYDGKEVLSKIVSVFNNPSDKLKIYPSPVKDVLNIMTESVGTLQVFNLLGQEVMQNTIKGQLDVSFLPKGTYILKIGTEQAKFTKL